MITNMEREIRKIVREEILIREREKEDWSELEERRGADWSKEEQKNLVGELKASISMMARFHKRTHIAIAYKLDKLYKSGAFEHLKWGKAWKGDK